MPNVCYPTLANQHTPRQFGPLWNPCNLPEGVENKISDASECLDETYEDSHACVVEKAKEAGLKYLGAGIHRAGFAFKGACVVKIAINSNGVDANRGEYDAWRQIGTHFKNIFAPVHDHADDFLWITQPRLVSVQTLGERRFKLEERLQKKMRKRGLDCGFDVRQHNIGVKAGGNDAFIFDYGLGTKCTLKTPSGTKVIEVRGGAIG